MGKDKSDSCFRQVHRPEKGADAKDSGRSMNESAAMLTLIVLDILPLSTSDKCGNGVFELSLLELQLFPSIHLTERRTSTSESFVVDDHLWS